MGVEEGMDTRHKMEDILHSRNIMGMIEGEEGCPRLGEVREEDLCRDHQQQTQAEDLCKDRQLPMEIEVATTHEEGKVEVTQTVVQSGEGGRLWTEVVILILDVSIVSAAIRLKLTFTSEESARPRNASSKTVEDPAYVSRSDRMG